MVATNTGEALLSEPDADGLRTLVLDRPDKANALDDALVQGLHDHLDRLGEETRVLVVRGAGKHFCAGFDFTDYEARSHGDLVLRFVRINELLARLRKAPYLTIAWVQGAAFGAGADIACSCAVRLGAARARFRFPGPQFGVVLGTRRLVHIVGAGRAREILAGNEELDARQARACGMLDEVVDEDGPEAIATRIARSMPRLDAEGMKRLLAVTEPDTHDADLADLVRSVAQPGLHARIARYRAASR